MKQRQRYQQAGKAPEGTLGTFAGVFTPSVLTILGIILFLRLGYVVGNAGLGLALLILLLANGISMLTSISLSAIATNLKVKGGGDYYLILRTLGHEFGGALGIVLFWAQSQSPSFRPRFRYFHKWLSLAGALACLGAMLAVDLKAGIVAVIVVLAMSKRKLSLSCGRASPKTAPRRLL